jgi:hypothetical protein
MMEDIKEIIEQLATDFPKYRFICYPINRKIAPIEVEM